MRRLFHTLRNDLVLHSTDRTRAITIELDNELIRLNNIWLRDCCSCSLCVDRSSTQKILQTADIGDQIYPESVHVLPSGLKVSWRDSDKKHVSLYNTDFLSRYANLNNVLAYRGEHVPVIPWNNLNVERVDYQYYMNDDAAFYRVLLLLQQDGLVVLTGVPPQPGVQVVAERVGGGVRNTFYGPTWDVRSVKNATNIAYTAQNLDLHMDLMYFESPPGLQFLHCLENDVVGGSSVFADAFKAAERVRVEDPRGWKGLLRQKVTYNYVNDDKHYYFDRPTVVLNDRPGINGTIDHVNYAPQFQGPFENLQDWATFHAYKSGIALFKQALNAGKIEFTLQQGECAIFQNRRVLHSRTEFDPESGNRWSKGTYVDIDAFKSMLRVMHVKHGED